LIQKHDNLTAENSASLRRNIAASQFPVGSVGYNLTLMRGIWHDKIELFELDGTPRSFDTQGGTPGNSPYENLVYIDFDGEFYRQTNVTFRGRPLHVRSFEAKLADGILRFGKLGEGDSGHVGVSGGIGILIFTPVFIDDSWKRYSEPDYISINGDTRTRNTMLYRDGKLVRTLSVVGQKLSPFADKRMSFDPRGEVGEVHDIQSVTQVFKQN
jgi:hypothetical protein